MSDYQLVGQELKSPLINAAGSVNGTNPETIHREIELLSKTDLGAITYGSITIPFSEGNEAKFGPPTHHYDEFAGKMYNSKGLPNVGRDEALTLVPLLAKIVHDSGK